LPTVVSEAVMFPLMAGGQPGGGGLESEDTGGIHLQGGKRPSPPERDWAPPPVKVPEPLAWVMVTEADESRSTLLLTSWASAVALKFTPMPTLPGTEEKTSLEAVTSIRLRSSVIEEAAPPASAAAKIEPALSAVAELIVKLTCWLSVTLD